MLMFLFINNILEKNLKNKIIIYSAIKIIANVPLLYSVLNPETSSLSPSAKSNGVRFSSATTEIIHNTNLIKNIRFKKNFCSFNKLKNLIDEYGNIILIIIKTNDTS